MPATVYYDKDADSGLIADKTVAILGYGSQGHAHALNLKDSGVDVIVGLREGSASKAKAEAAGLRVLPTGEAVREADIVMVLLPDTEQKKVYEADIAPNLVDGNSLAFAHGFNIHFDQIKPAAGVDVWMIAPKGPGHLVRRTYEEGGGVPCLVAIENDATGKAKQTARRSKKRPRPTSSVSRLCCAAGSSNSFATATRRSSRPATSPSPRISRRCTR